MFLCNVLWVPGFCNPFTDSHFQNCALNNFLYVIQYARVCFVFFVFFEIPKEFLILLPSCLRSSRAPRTVRKFEQAKPFISFPSNLLPSLNQYFSFVCLVTQCFCFFKIIFFYWFINSLSIPNPVFLWCLPGIIIEKTTHTHTQKMFNFWEKNKRQSK